MIFLVGETFGQAIIDTGCPKTVCGQDWFDVYIDTLSRKDRDSLKTKTSNDRFRFGNGVFYPSQYHAIIPIYVGQSRYELGVDVVNCSIPLLLSRETLERANAKIDIGNATIQMLGANVPMITTTSGHLCLPIGRSYDITNTETKRVLSDVLFTSPFEGIGSDLKNKVTKLHRQFAHPTADRLINLIKNAGTADTKVFDTIREITSNCDICAKHRKPPLRPAVGFPLACEFNEAVVILSLEVQMYILHMMII